MVVVFIFSLSGVIIALLNNDFVIEKSSNSLLKNNNIDLKDEIKDNKDPQKTIKENNKESNKYEKEKDKDTDGEIKNKIEEDDKNKKDIKQKNEKEEEKKKETEEKQKNDKYEKINEEEKKKQENKKENQKEEEIIERTKTSNIHRYTKEGKIRIACAYALDNSYVFPTLVAMTSLAENASKKTFYDIYVMISTGFKDENKEILLSVEIKHKEHCKIYFIDMADKFKKADTNQKITTPTYYRLELPSLLPDVNRIIWMDGDTAVFEDLTELITLNMKGNYIMGFLDSLPKAIGKFGIKDATVLCSGVLLLDLEALRKNNMSKKFDKFISENKGKINQHDQTVINVVCQGHTARLPPKYGMWDFDAEMHALMHNNRQRWRLKYNKKEFIYAYYHPAILHYVWPKPFWKRMKRTNFSNKWWDYAKKTDYYDVIYNKSQTWFTNN